MSEQQSSPDSSTEDGVFSLEDLDKIIEAEDPTFKEQMENIQTTGFDASVSIESMDVDSAESEPIPDENRKLTRAEKIVEDIKSRVSAFREKSKNKYQMFKTRSFELLQTGIQFAKHELPERLKYYRSKIVSYFKLISQFFKNEISRFKALKPVEKAGLIFVIFSTTFSFFFLSKVYTGGWLPRFSSPLIHSFENEGTQIGSYKDKSELQSLFHAFPDVEIPVLLTKVIVNLKPDSNSSRNPMGIYEVYLGLDSKDTAVEVKAREREMLDYIQRALEPFSYSEVSSEVGKVRMKSAIRDQINTLLNQGQVVNVYFNTFISNP